MSETVEEKWDDEIERWTPRRVKVWVWLLIAAVILAPLVAWGASVVLSGPEGAGNVIRQNNDADNRISAQAYFEDAYANVKKYDVQITDAQKQLDQFLQTTPKPDSSDVVAAQLYTQQLNNRQTTVTGVQQQCQNTVAAYNAEARKTIRADWRSPDLPYQIDSSDQATDCLPAA